MKLDFDLFFSLLILVVHTLSLKNPSDATLHHGAFRYIQDDVQDGGEL